MNHFERHTIVNIVRAEITTEEEKPRVLCFDTVTSAEPEPVISKGDESELRVRNTILAQDTLEDIIKGYDITLKDCVLCSDLLEIIDGGSKVLSLGTTFPGYNSPAAGSASQRIRFTLRLYAEEKDYGGETIGIFRFSFPNCVGTPAKFGLENGSFAAPEYLVRSRPRSGGCALTVEYLDRLPVYCSDISELPENPAEGDCVTATYSITDGKLSLSTGDTAYFNGIEWLAMG